MAYEVTGSLPDPARFRSEGQGAMQRQAPAKEVEVQIRKPNGHSVHH